MILTNDVRNMQMPGTMSKNKKIFEIASQQQGYFTAKQALQAGFSYRMQYHYKHARHWLEIERGIFRLVQYPNSPSEDLVRWSLWSRNRADNPQAIISHQTALSIHELSDVMPAKIYLTVPPTFRKKIPEGCIIYKSVINSEEIEQREGFRITNPLRTIIDVAESNLSMDHLEQAVRDACDKGLLRPINIINAKMSNKAKRKIETVFDNIKKRSIF